MDYIFSTNKSISAQQVSELKDKLANGAVAIGAYKGYEQIVSKSTSASFALVSYLVTMNQVHTFVFGSSAGSPMNFLCSSPQLSSALITGLSAYPIGVNSYSTRGGTSA